jgi:hypothetical protein
MVQHQRGHSVSGRSSWRMGDYRKPNPGGIVSCPSPDIPRPRHERRSVCAVSTCQPGLTNRNLNLEGFRSQFLHDVSLDHIAVFDITEIFQGNAAFEPGPHFGGIVFESA